MRFSTTRFFTDQFLRSYRMSRLKELLLLACRMLLFGLFAFALAQPLLRPKNVSAAGLEGDRVAIVLAGRRESGPELLVAEPTGNRGEALQAIDRLQVSSLGTDLTGAV